MIVIHRCRWTACVDGSRQVHLFQHQAQWQQCCPRLYERTTHHGGTEVDGATVLDISAFYFQSHILEGMQLHEAIDHTVVTKVYCIPVRSLHG